MSQRSAKPKTTNQPTIWMTVGQGPIVLAVGAGGVLLDILLDIFTLYGVVGWCDGAW